MTKIIRLLGIHHPVKQICMRLSGKYKHLLDGFAGMWSPVVPKHWNRSPNDIRNSTQEWPVAFGVDRSFLPLV